VIAMQSNEHAVNRLCQLLSVSRSGYYAWRQRGPSLRTQEDNRLKEVTQREFDQSRGTYGSRRLAHRLRELGHRCSRRRVARLMRELGLVARQKRKRAPRTTIVDVAQRAAPNVLEQTFTADYPHQIWVADITYIDTMQGWAYLAAIVDVYTRQVIGWALADHMRTELIETAFQMAVGRCHPPAGLIHHSDRGSQYTSNDYQKTLRDHQVMPSMSRTGNCYDNALAESFFSTLKFECVIEPFQSVSEARQTIFEYIEVWYNQQRLHSSLDYQSPAVFEQIYWDNLSVH
jgi:putative transposase